MTLSDIAKVVRFPKPTILRLCATLIEYGFLQFDELKKEYSPGLKFFEIGGLLHPTFSINKVAPAHIARLQKAVGEEIFVDILQDDQIMHVDARDEPTSPVQIRIQIGRRRPPHFGATGWVLMAHLPDEKVEQLLEKFPLEQLTEKSITDKRLFKERLKNIRSQGFAVDDGETIDVIGAVSAPVRNKSGRVIAAIAVSYVSHSKNRNKLDFIITETVKAADAISKAMGYFKNSTEEGMAGT
jgi:DNA-binding IclR family transcriptional regulator